MLDDFIAAHALAIEERTRQRLEGRVYPSLSPRELEYGVPLFLTQLAETLRLESTPAPFAINGSTGAVLGRSLIGMRDVVAGALSEVRLAAGQQVRKRVRVMTLIDEIAATGSLHSEYRQIEFSVAAVDPELAVDADPQLLASAVTNLLQNAFKYTPAGGHVSLQTYVSEGRLFIAVKDECGGFPQDRMPAFQSFGDRRGTDRTGLGLGLSIARKAMRAHDGDIHIQNLPAVGCVFTIDMPLAAPIASTPLRDAGVPQV